MPPMLTLPTPGDVHALIPQRAGSGFGTDTSPTAAEVSALIDMVGSEVASGLPDPLPAGLESLATTTVALGAAAQAEIAFYPEQAATNSAGEKMLERYRETLERLRQLALGDGHGRVRRAMVSSVPLRAAHLRPSWRWYL